MRQHLQLMVLLIILLHLQTQAQVVSFQSGPWQSGTTWAGGVIPDSNTNVNIAAAHLITIEDGQAACKSITFSDTSSHLIMSSDISILNVYGDFTLFSTAHKVFSSWIAGAKIVFTGYAPEQNLIGWNTAGNSTSFQEMIVDKGAGKVSTARNNMRFCFGTTLEIRNGTFELDSLDDLESKTIGGTGLDGNIIVQSNGIFTMIGGTSHVRKGTYLLSSDSISPRIGTMTVYGQATLTSSSSN